MHHLIKDFNQKPKSKITKCELPNRRNNLGKKVLLLDKNMGGMNVQKTLKAKKALRRFKHKKMLVVGDKPSTSIKPVSPTNYEPNDITSTTNSSVNVVISHIEKFIQRKRQESMVAILQPPIQPRPIPPASNNEVGGISPRFSFLDVTSLWQDPETC